MSKYILTSDKFEGSITYGYNDNGLLDYFEMATNNMDRGLHEMFTQHLGHALEESNFKAWAAHYRFKIVQLEEDLSFDRFWNLYANKRNIDKARPIYKGMSDANKVLVIANLKAYNRYCDRNRTWYNKMLPDTYLRSHWKDEWDKAK